MRKNTPEFGVQELHCICRHEYKSKSALHGHLKGQVHMPRKCTEAKGISETNLLHINTAPVPIVLFLLFMQIAV